MTPGKMGGLEMMIRSIMKAFGVDPETLRAEIETRLKGFEDATKNMDANLQNISMRLDRIDHRLDRIEIHLGFIAGEVPFDESVRDPELKPQPMKLKESDDNGETKSQGNRGRSGSRGH